MNNSKENESIRIYIFCMLLLGITPILALFLYYLTNPESHFLNTIYNYANSFPEITSSQNEPMSKTMSLYIKTAPLMAFISFLMIYKKISPNPNLPNISIKEHIIRLLKLNISLIVFYIIMIYFFLFYNQELTTSGKLLRLMSQNDYFLLLFYISLYFCIYIFSFMLFSIFVVSYKLIKERL